MLNLHLTRRVTLYRHPLCFEPFGSRGTPTGCVVSIDTYVGHFVVVQPDRHKCKVQRVEGILQIDEPFWVLTSIVRPITHTLHCRTFEKGQKFVRLEEWKEGYPIYTVIDVDDRRDFTTQDHLDLLVTSCRDGLSEMITLPLHQWTDDGQRNFIQVHV